VPGLVAEAESPSVLGDKLRILISELLELNGVPSRAAKFHVRYEHEESGVLASRWWASRLSESRFFANTDVSLTAKAGTIRKMPL
jgi:Domain of unknown function (DUF1902)